MEKNVRGDMMKISKCECGSGSEPRIVQHFNGSSFAVYCIDCPNEGTWAATEDEATNLWNKKMEEPSVCDDFAKHEIVEPEC